MRKMCLHVFLVSAHFQTSRQDHCALPIRRLWLRPWTAYLPESLSSVFGLQLQVSPRPDHAVRIGKHVILRFTVRPYQPTPVARTHTRHTHTHTNTHACGSPLHHCNWLARWRTAEKSSDGVFWITAFLSAVPQKYPHAGRGFLLGVKCVVHRLNDRKRMSGDKRQRN